MGAGPANSRYHTWGWKYLPVLVLVAWVSDWQQLSVSAVNIWPQLIMGLKEQNLSLSLKLPSLVCLGSCVSVLAGS